MKWFKHDCDMSSDFKIRDLIQMHGVEGYGVWLICLEILGKEGELKGEKWSVLGKKRWIYHAGNIIGWSSDGQKMDKLKNIINSIADLGLISKKSLKYGNLYCPNFQKRIDEYSQKKLRTISGQYPEKHAVDKEQDRDKEEDKKKSKSIAAKPPVNPKPEPNPDLQRVIKHICDSWERKKGMKYPFNGKHAKLILTQCSRYEPAGVMALWDLFLRNDQGDPFFVKCGFSIEGFVTCIPRLADMGYKGVKQKYEKSEFGFKPAETIVKDLQVLSPGV